jgi:hypothetical protein
MGAAASVRYTLAALDHVTRAKPRPELRFYNLSLHQKAEANEVGYFGAVSKGTLLEWIDRMFTTPATFADRTVGKWVNAVMAHGDFLPLESRLQMSFKRFGLSCGEPLKHGEFDEYEPRSGCSDARTPTGIPPFGGYPTTIHENALPRARRWRRTAASAAGRGYTGQRSRAAVRHGAAARWREPVGSEHA